jgi:hypothetical protein
MTKQIFILFVMPYTSDLQRSSIRMIYFIHNVESVKIFYFSCGIVVKEEK